MMRPTHKIFLCVLLLYCHWGLAQERVLIAAASDLKFALDSVVAVFKTEYKADINVAYGSSGKLTEQILNGAPFDIFFSADIDYPQLLKEKGKTSSDLYLYARGRLVIWSATIQAAKLQVDALLHNTVNKIAIANPAHAPYGKRAVEFLQHQNLYGRLESKLVYGENISQAAQFVASGAAEIGIIALSLARSPNMLKLEGSYFEIPERMHNALIQGAVITSNGKHNQAAAVLFDFIKSAKAVAIFKHFGFLRP